jgi:hypothetical protein
MPTSIGTTKPRNRGHCSILLSTAFCTSDEVSAEGEGTADSLTKRHRCAVMPEAEAASKWICSAINSNRTSVILIYVNEQQDRTASTGMAGTEALHAAKLRDDSKPSLGRTQNQVLDLLIHTLPLV